MEQQRPFRRCLDVTEGGALHQGAVCGTDALIRACRRVHVGSVQHRPATLQQGRTLGSHMVHAPVLCRAYAAVAYLPHAGFASGTCAGPRTNVLLPVQGDCGWRPAPSREYTLGSLTRRGASQRGPACSTAGDRLHTLPQHKHVLHKAMLRATGQGAAPLRQAVGTQAGCRQRHMAI